MVVDVFQWAHGGPSHRAMVEYTYEFSNFYRRKFEELV